MDEAHYIRFMKKVDTSAPNGCWNWTAATANYGYGVFRLEGRMLNAHRASYLHFKGDPDHLEAVTHRENMLRGETFAARHHIKTHCSRGHEFTYENTYTIRNKNGSPKGRLCRKCRRYYVMRNYYRKKELEQKQT